MLCACVQAHKWTENAQKQCKKIIGGALSFLRGKEDEAFIAMPLARSSAADALSPCYWTWKQFNTSVSTITRNKVFAQGVNHLLKCHWFNTIVWHRIGQPYSNSWSWTVGRCVLAEFLLWHTMFKTFHWVLRTWNPRSGSAKQALDSHLFRKTKGSYYKLGQEKRTA